MGKFKNMLSLLGAVLCVAGCAYLPGLFVRISQGLQLQKTSYEPVQSVSVQPERKTLMDKLELLCFDGQSVFVSDNAMHSTRQEITNALTQYLKPFWEQELFPHAPEPAQEYEMDLEPCLIFNKAGTEQDRFWKIRFLLDYGKGIIHIYTIMDDDTHSVLQFNYADHSLDHTNAVYETQWVPDKPVDEICGLFFDALGVQVLPKETMDSNIYVYRLAAPSQSDILFRSDEHENGFTMLLQQ